jgi:tetratricopeptide (TPR) repeat protein
MPVDAVAERQQGAREGGLISKLSARLKEATAAGRHHEVVDLARQAWSEKATSWIALVAYRSAKALGDRQRAAWWIDQGLSRAPDDWRLLRAKGDLAVEQEQLGPAADCYRKAAAAAPDQPTLFIVLGKVLAQLERNAEAAESLETGLKLAGDKAHPTWLVQLAKARTRLQRTAEAAEAWRAAIKLAGDEVHPTWLAQLGMLLSQLQRYTEAAEALRAAVNAAGDEAHPTWLAQLGNAERKNGNLSAGLAALSRANGIRPNRSLAWQIADLERRIAQRGSESLEATVDYYDDVFTDQESYHEHWRASPYAGAWEAIIAQLRDRKVELILDLGCGPGQFAQAVHELLPGRRYHGVDFSEVAIERAARLLPEFQFTKVSLPIPNYAPFGAFDCVVCTEVLEHVDDDLAILETVPAGTQVVFSVPNFDSFGHVRLFDSASSVHARYGHLFHDLAITSASMGGRHVLWLATGVKKEAEDPLDSTDIDSRA